jgi:peptide/nickel transport system substrate-binding protein
MRTRIIRAVAALVCVVVVACGPASPAPEGGGAGPTPEPRSGGILRIGQNAADLGTLDPHYASGTQDRALVDMVFNGLIRYKPGDATAFAPDLAATLPGATTNPDGKQTWTFVLRQGVMCQPSEGVPAYELTSDDVVYSLRKAANKDTSAYASDYAGMTFSNPDPYTLVVTLDQPLSSALFYPRFANYSGGYILCKKAAENIGLDGLKTHPVGTGPFTFKSYSPKEKVDLVANDAYFRGKPRLDGIEYRYMADLSSRELGLRGGQLDVIAGLQDGKWLNQVSNAPNVKVDVFGVGEVTTVYFNTTRPPFDNLLLRKAVASALNRDEFMALSGSEVSEKVYSPVPARFMPGGLTGQEAAERALDYPFEPTKARDLLKQAGLPSGFTFGVVTSEMPAYRTIYESMQAQLARVGITMDIQVVDHATMHDEIRKNVNPLVVYVAFRPTADTYLTQFLHSGINTDFSHYDKLDDLIDKARSESNEVTQQALWKQAQHIALADMIAYPIGYTNQVYARTSRVDYGHELSSVVQLYPGIDETTRLAR